ncbi:MAG: SDR family oxidoreductase [Chthoniobacterales bacterium]|nr:SDR family oxidoreductase [Chthoniobacterales bacterium]
MKKNRSLSLAFGAAALMGWGIARALAPQISFQGKVVLITGGSRGLGLVLARQLCDQGARVILLARDQAELQRAHDELVAAGGDVSILPCDLLERSQIEEAVRTVIDHFGRIDVLINNAGIIEVGPLEHTERADFERAMQLHLWAPFTLMWEVIPHMRRAGGGRIVNITSIGGKIAVPHLAAYCASKFALVGLSDSMRAELARDGIYVTTVAPGMMRTGSHVNANFKGQHAAEFGWFAISNSMPLISMKAERAAAQILDACRRGRPEITLTLAARAAIIGNAVFPSLTGHIMKVVNSILPGPTDPSGNTMQSGGESRSTRLTPKWLTGLADSAIKRNNESHSGNGSH